ncbi:MAG TPA: right-handed parallel beta-helix repeat-containing protein [Steroidobacteraceae bacterium]|jgi:hypothetical protein
MAIDWFVAADGGPSGDGSRESPFHDLWLAIRCASPGDVVHIAAGTYYGRYDRSSWTIDCPNLEIRGGYSRDFSSRAPWKTPSVLAFWRGYEAPRENNMISWREDHAGLCLDGLYFDGAGANLYGDGPEGGISSYPTMAGPILSFNAANVTIRNCIFVNAANGGVQLSGAGSRFENNLIINLIGLAMLELRSSPRPIDQPITAKNNSFCFMHDVADPAGGGADSATGIRVNCPAIVQDNLFLSCGNAAISVLGEPAQVLIERNLFFLTPRALARCHALGSSGEITEKNFDELEDVGMKSCADNRIQDPGMVGLPPPWFDAYSRQLLANYSRPPYDAANALRTAAGLPALSPDDLRKPENAKGELAPRLAVSDVLTLAFTAKQGHHAIELTAQIPVPPATPAPAYPTIQWGQITAPDASLANTRVELRAGLGFEQNVCLLADANSETHMGIQVYQPGSDDVSIRVLIPRYTLPARQYQNAVKYNRGVEVESCYSLRGVYRTDVDASARQKVTLVVEVVLPAPLAASAPSNHPAGRDWFVRAGASGGDGSREKPFRDPFQALDKAEGGDVIHVALGDYFGKLHSGQWRITVRYLTLLGGYDAEFSERDPWTHPTCFLLGEDEKAKGRPSGTILGSEENSDGLLVDGFIFDGASWNTYGKDGSLDGGTSPLAPLLDLGGGRAIAVRNCVFVNGSSSAVNISCPSGVFENNVLVNTCGDALTVRAEGAGPWTVRNNTLLFASDPTQRAGTGKSSSGGTLLQLKGRAVVNLQSNILAFADNFGARLTIAQQNLTLDNNVFAANLFNHLTDAGYLWADGSNWQRRAVADAEFASFRDNSLELPPLPVDTAFADAALARLTSLPSRITRQEWGTIAPRIGTTVAAVPTVVADPTPPPATTVTSAATAHSGSITDLLASLSSMKVQMAKTEGAKPAAAAPLFCPRYDWRKALTLAQGGSETTPGAHRLKLTVAFAAPRPTAQITYAIVTAQVIDADHAALDHQPVELQVTEVRNSSTNPSWFPAGMTKDDYDAYSVATPGEATRTRLALIVRMDTNVSKLVSRFTPTQKLRIRGTARVPANPGALSIVVDSAEAVEG